MNDETEQLLLQLTQQLLDSITSGDWESYQSLCDPSLTAFEPEARGALVSGMAFHKFYFDLSPPQTVQTTIASPHVRLLGSDVAIVSFVRLVQRAGGSETAHTVRFEETRVWHRQGEAWKHVHFHRSSVVG